MLLYAIERKRNQMILLAEKYGYTSEATVKCSQELDKLLNLAQQPSSYTVKIAK
ncbi:aspartyl-phosphate phosphatase Spo0E family protein [Alkalihalobacillus sp. BA299]|uniref:aspartyl-phosphate phosphatase Spo0E family protein n=1 Tax=Alkalihalobacillus sp. BA299 TaxID=2815938 RepID=UPI001ADD43DB|nr:aspartyl-phosphate phosphatase Spo0E family protein [Alkalihalobacillus sp. BA299]